MSACISRPDQLKEHLARQPDLGRASAANPLVLYDIESSLDPMAWSPSVWNTRFVLNYKKIPYRTIWLCIADIKSELQKLGFRPTGIGRDGADRWTLPVIEDPSPNGDGPTKVVDSHIIAEYLDVKYPANPVFPRGTKGLTSLFIKWTHTNLNPYMIHLVVPEIANILDGPAKEYYESTRRPWWGGKELKDICTGEERTQAWTNLKREFDLLDSHLSRNDEGDFLMGNILSYGDFVLAALFIWMRKAPSAKDAGCETVWDVMKDWNGGRWARIVEHFTQYEAQG